MGGDREIEAPRNCDGALYKLRTPNIAGLLTLPEVRQVKSEELPQGEAKVTAVRSMFDRIAPRYELVNRVITFGMDAHWRNVAVSRLALPFHSTVLDLACGTGDFCRLLTSRGHIPFGVDLSLGMLEHARTTAPLVQADVLNLPFPDKAIDGITCGFGLRNFVDLPQFFAELARVVRPGGRIALLDASLPDNKVIRAGHSFYFGKVVPKIGALLSDGSAYAYLPASLSYLPPASTIDEWLGVAGFHEILTKKFLGGAASLITATR
jgi:demethylmenaquinone methyltransferase / 2-methoxy-6-polyprenyl-1,4-benzoquinol methylase